MYVNDGPGLTMTYKMVRSNVVAYTLECENLLQSLLIENKKQKKT